MPANAYGPAIVEHNDLVGVLDGADSLGNNHHGLVPLFPKQRPAQGPLGFEIQGGKAVVKNIELGILYNGPGNGQPLPLAPGKVRSPLGHKGIQPLGQGPDKVSGLGNLQGLPKLLLGGVLFAVTKVFGDGAGKQPGPLLHIGHIVPELALRHLPDIHAAKGNRPLGDIVKPKHQGGNGGFATAGAPDNRRGLPPFAEEGKTLQGVFIGIRIPKGHLVKGQNIFPVGKGNLLPDVVPNLGRIGENLPNAVCAFQGTGQLKNHKLRHQHTEQGHNGVFHNGRNVSYPKYPGDNTASAEPVHQHHKKIDGKIRQSVQAGKKPVDPNRGGLIGPEGLV